MDILPQPMSSYRTLPKNMARRHPRLLVRTRWVYILTSSIFWLSYVSNGKGRDTSARPRRFGNASVAGDDEGTSDVGAPGDTQHRGVRCRPFRLRRHGDAAAQRTAARQ